MIFEGTKINFFGLLLLPLCNELEITVNELLSGERVSEEEYLKKAEENMVNLVRETQESKRKLSCQQ